VVAGFTKYEVDKNKKFRRALEQAAGKVEDLRVPLEEIAQNWFSTNTVIFEQKGPGKFEDLTSQTKQKKMREIGTAYPILYRYGFLRESLTNPNDSFAMKMVDKKSLQLGTKVPYAMFHQLGTKNMPQRMVVFIGPESPFKDDAGIRDRVKNWSKILLDFVIAKTKGSGAAK